jgi:hypothetical protein
LIPVEKGGQKDDNALIATLLGNLRQNIQKDINDRFDRLKACSKIGRLSL